MHRGPGLFRGAQMLHFLSNLTGKTYRLRCCESADSTILRIKGTLLGIEGMPSDGFALFFRGERVGLSSMHQTLADIGFQEGDELLLLHTMKGGGPGELERLRDCTRKPEIGYLRYYADTFKQEWRVEHDEALMHLLLELSQNCGMQDGNITDETWLHIQNAMNNLTNLKFQIDFLKERLRHYQQLYSLLADTRSRFSDRQGHTIIWPQQQYFSFESKNLKREAPIEDRFLEMHVPVKKGKKKAANDDIEAERGEDADRQDGHGSKMSDGPYASNTTSSLNFTDPKARQIYEMVKALELDQENANKPKDRPWLMASGGSSHGGKFGFGSKLNTTSVHAAALRYMATPSMTTYVSEMTHPENQTVYTSAEVARMMEEKAAEHSRKLAEKEQQLADVCARRDYLEKECNDYNNYFFGQLFNSIGNNMPEGLVQPRPAVRTTFYTGQFAAAPENSSSISMDNRNSNKLHHPNILNYSGEIGGVRGPNFLNFSGEVAGNEDEVLG